MCCIPDGCSCCEHCCGVDQTDACPKDCSCAESTIHTDMEMKLFGYHNQKPIKHIISDLLNDCKKIQDATTKLGAMRVLEELQRRCGFKKK